MVNRYESFKRRIAAIAGMYAYNEEAKKQRNDLEWDLICDIILCPTEEETGSSRFITEYEKANLLFSLATGTEYEGGNEYED